MRRLLDATISLEKVVATRDGKVAVVQSQYAEAIAGQSGLVSTLEGQLEEFYRAHPPAEAKSIRFPHGLIGVREASQAALLPLNEKWTWEKISRKLRRVFKARFFHTPKPPGIDKVKIKRELSAEQLAACGMKLETSETFYVELARLPEAA